MLTGLLHLDGGGLLEQSPGESSPRKYKTNPIRMDGVFFWLRGIETYFP